MFAEIVIMKVTACFRLLNCFLPFRSLYVRDIRVENLCEGIKQTVVLPEPFVT